MIKIGYKLYPDDKYPAYYLIVVLRDGSLHQVGTPMNKLEMRKKLLANGVDMEKLKQVPNTAIWFEE